MTPEERAEKLVEKHESVFESGGMGQMEYDIDKEIRAAVEEEREACAEVAEFCAAHSRKFVGNDSEANAQAGVAGAIRARGKKKFCGCGQPSKDPVTGGCGEC